jgi:two-component system, cell cycle sensor histidine kinase and response regulator CckA
MSKQEMKELQNKLNESENKFQLLFEKAPLAYQSLDVDGNILEVNEKWLETLGYTREEVIGKNMGDFLAGEWKDHFKTKFSKFKSIGEVLGVEFELMKKDGQSIVISVQGRVGTNKYGEFKQTHCIFMDVTQTRLSEARTKRLERELIRSKKSEAIGRFSREIIHDLNNILTPLTFSVQMLELNILESDPNFEWLRRIKSSIDRAKELINEINSFSKPIPVETYQSLYIQPIIEEVLDLVHVPNYITLKKDIQKFNYTLRGLTIKVHQIVMNLMTNAIASIDPDEGGIISVKFKLVDVKDNNIFIPNAPPGTYSCLTIKDTGCGMTEDLIGKIFEPFFTTRSEGTGLGMAVVDTLIKSMNGYICVDSEIGVGTKIRVYFPMKKDELII